MIHDDILFHNTAELVPADDGLLLQRVPADVYEGLEPAARARARQAANTELRFVIDAPVTITLSCPEGPMLLRRYHGDLQIYERCVIKNQPTPVTVVPSSAKFRADSEKARLHGAFHPRVVRLTAGGAQPAGRLLYHGRQGTCRPPRRDELPDKTMLAYGTSITQGFNATQPHLTWPAIAARELACDWINLGMAGACQCEQSIADHIAERDDWDVAVLPLSVNMVDLPYEEFRRRVDYLVRGVVARRPTKPVVCVTLFPFFRDFGIDLADRPDVSGDPERYRQILRDVVGEVATPGLHLLEGPAMMPRRTDLAIDLIHPTDHGLTAIGLNIAKHIQPLMV